MSSLTSTRSIAGFGANFVTSMHVNAGAPSSDNERRFILALTGNNAAHVTTIVRATT
jgi:hypothetical protein